MDHWILVADAGSARIYCSDEALAAWTLVRRIDNERIHLDAAELVSDRRGATRSRPGGERSALDRHTDPHEVERVRFARAVAEVVDDGLLREQFERLVIVAPPRFLGTLRRALSPRVAGRVAASIDHDFTRTAEPELPAAVRRHLPADAGRDL